MNWAERTVRDCERSVALLIPLRNAMRPHVGKRLADLPASVAEAMRALARDYTTWLDSDEQSTFFAATHRPSATIDGVIHIADIEERIRAHGERAATLRKSMILA